ncbi:MAG: hypothetical protein IJG53_04500, partial [Eggerthellaceae bacterium]|nr:hypothetical protein [Eggerthellaceae bacterium]
HDAEPFMDAAVRMEDAVAQTSGCQVIRHVLLTSWKRSSNRQVSALSACAFSMVQRLRFQRNRKNERWNATDGQVKGGIRHTGAVLAPFG